MVEYADGSVIAQLGQPDMRTPIACALAYPERIESGAAPLDFTTLGALEFERVDAQRFPCVGLAREAIREGGTAPAVLNAANEIAVESFLDGQAFLHRHRRGDRERAGRDRAWSRSCPSSRSTPRTSRRAALARRYRRAARARHTG